MADYASRRRYAHLIPKLHPVAIVKRAAQPVDLVRLRKAETQGYRKTLAQQTVQGQGPIKLGFGRVQTAALSASVTGILPWWTYQSRTIPGVGTAMVNVANLNFLFAESDVHVPEGGIDLTFSRIYNSESGHDANNDDGSTASVFGNRWTNNLDIHLGWLSTGQNTGTISVYSADGARFDYACQINVVETCTSLTPGIFDLLATTQLGGNGIACQLQWTLKSGISYIFAAPYANCTSNQPGYYGRLLAIYGRNATFSIQLAYSWSPDPSSPENIAQITATHMPDNSALVLTFGQIAGSSPKITELTSIERPDGEYVDYHYNATGELNDIDKPGNNPILDGESLPTKFPDGTPILHAGNMPEIYDIEHAGLMEVCGPRATISIVNTGGNPNDGACIDFDYSNKQLSDWYTRGVLNPTPPDDVNPSPIQNGQNPYFSQWNDTDFFNNMIGGCGNESVAVMSDQLEHYVEWCYDANNRVTTKLVLVTPNTSNFLTTNQTWDSNNDLTSKTDARGYETDLAYDTNGNLVEVSLPRQTTSTGTVRPTSFYDHDSYNNLIAYCDPANNASDSWNPSPGPTPCAGSGSTYKAQFEYATDSNEPYGCLTQSSSLSGYETTTTYSAGNGCGTGEPTTVQPSPYPQATGTYNPKFKFTYNNNGLLATYDPADPDDKTWQLTYTSNGTNLVRSTSDPTGVTSYQCHNLDGSLFYSETAYQNDLDQSPSCPSNAQLISGASPPPYAVGYGYDPDDDIVEVMHHHDCTGSSCAANSHATTKCYGVNVAAGMICDFYDGLDRLVEVKQPYDKSVDLYANPWITRYLYDLTGGQQSFHGQAFYASGNLFAIEELLPVAPSGPTPSVTAPPTPGQVSNPTYQNIKATAYDGADRPVVKFAASGSISGGYTSEALTWDTSPIDPNGVAGSLGKVCNSASPQQCQWFDYLPDGELMTFESSDSSSPERDYQYDPDGRVTQIASNPPYANPQTYTYNIDGYLRKSVDAGNSTSDQATLTHNRYPDGREESLDVASSVLNQTGLFTYSYRNDGPLQTEVINDSNINGIKNAGQTALTYSYTDAARLKSRSESGVAAYPAPTPQTTITYQANPATGLVQSETTPVTGMSSFSYSAESELLGVSLSGGNGQCIGSTFGYSLRGELVSSPNCSVYGGNIGTFLANGVSLRIPSSVGGEQYTWDDLIAVPIDELATVGTNCGGQACQSFWQYDKAGRMNTQQQTVPPIGQNQQNIQTARTYDAENHLLHTQFQNGQSPSWPNAQLQWGPDGHPITVATWTGNNSKNYERLHWNGDQLLFTTNSYNGSTTLDDIKVDVQGDILPTDGGYNGLTFYDRAPGGTIMGCHNATGTSYVGLNDSWLTSTHSPCSQDQSQGAKMPTSVIWSSGPGNDGPGAIGQGGVLGTPRADGFTDGFDTIQGVRAYDASSGAWMSPDRYQGSLGDPASQKSYLWNANNPISNSDLSGFSDGTEGQDTPVQAGDCSGSSPATCSMNNPPGCTSGPGCVSSDPNCVGCTPPCLNCLPTAAQASQTLEGFGPNNFYNVAAGTTGVFGGWEIGAGRAAEDIIGGLLLKRQLAAEEAASVFTTSGELTQAAIAGSRQIIPAAKLGNEAVPAGFSKYSTQSYQSPSGLFQVHFYMNDIGEVYYDADYKAVFTYLP